MSNMDDFHVFKSTNGGGDKGFNGSRVCHCDCGSYANIFHRRRRKLGRNRRSAEMKNFHISAIPMNILIKNCAQWCTLRFFQRIVHFGVFLS